MWARVAEKFAPFNIDVTTENPGSFANTQAQHMIIGGDGAWAGSPGSGISQVGSFYNSQTNASYVFPAVLGNDPHYTAEIIAHEAGHSFGLNHQSTYSGSSKTAEYNSGDILRAPIMGSPFSAIRGLWWYGANSTSSTSIQDDLAVISSSSTNKFGYRADDHGGSAASADLLTASGSSLSGSGVVEITSDSDWLAFTTAGGSVSFTASVGSYVRANAGTLGAGDGAGATLDLTLELRDAAGNLIASSDTASLGETVAASGLAAGTYYIVVKSHGGYGDVGTYDITGTATPIGGGGGAPIANPGGGYSALEGTGGSVVLSGAGSTAGDGGTTGLTYAWDLDGDGIFGETGASALHGNETGVSTTFVANGLDGPSTYAVSLKVTDSGGLSATASTSISITNAAPVITPSGLTSVSEGSTYTLNFSATDAGNDSISSWSINWGDGSAATVLSGGATSATHVFADNHAYTVTVSATDKDGGVGSATKSVSVANVAPVAFIFGAPVSSPEGTAVNLTSSILDPGTADTFTYAWSVTKNGAAYKSGTASTFTFTPIDNGTYVVSLLVTDKDGATASDSETVAVTNVSPTPTINTPPATSPEGTLISLTGSAVDPGTVDTLTYAWGVTKNGQAYTTGSGTTFNFTPNDNATYVVTLTVTDKDGGVASTSKTIAGTNVAPTPSIAGAPASSAEGTAISLTGSAIDPGTLDSITYAWRVTKNGAAYTTGAGAAFTFTPNDNGSYVVTLTATDKDGGAASTSRTITATNVAPTASIIGAPSTSLEGATISLTGSATDPGTLDTFTYAWNVTRNGTAYTTGSGSAFNLLPTDNGTYVVTLTATDKDGAASIASKSIAVVNVAPTVSITGAPASSAEGTAVNLASSVVDPGGTSTFTYAWAVTRNGVAYKSGAASTFTFTPIDDGTFVVTLTVTDQDGVTGTAASQTVAVTNVAPVSTIGDLPATSPEGAAISTTGSATDAGPADTVTLAWSVTKNGAAYASGTGATISFIPDDNANYVVTLTATDTDGAVGTASKSITVTNVAPALHLTGSTMVYRDAPYNLTFASADPGADTITAWIVNWGDGQVETINGNPQSASHVYTADGDFMISASAQDEDGAFAAGNSLVFGVSDVADVTAPAASLASTPTVTTGDTVSTFTVNYTDDTAIDPSTFGDGDVLVTGPNGFSQLAHFVSSTQGAGAGSYVATYTFTAPGGTWTSGGNGIYTFALQDNQVADINGNYAPGAALGTLAVKLPIPDLGGDTLAQAAYIGIVSPGYAQTFNDYVSKGDRNDYYRLRIKSKTTVDFKMYGLTDNADLQLLDASGRVLQSSARAGTRTEAFSRVLGAGTYYLRSYYPGGSFTPYWLRVSCGSTAPGDALATDRIGDTLTTARDAGTLYRGQSMLFSAGLMDGDTTDFYVLNLAQKSSFNVQLYGLADNAQLQLLDRRGRVLATSASKYLRDEAIGARLKGGTYFVRVFSNAPITTSYTLKMSA
jgi:hypothetical protein